MTHVFTLEEIDAPLFEKYPITHLALESYGTNKERAFQDYPEIMNNAHFLTVYILRGMPVEIYRVKEHTGNLQAEVYQLSDFEKAQILIEEGKTDSAITLLNQFNARNPENQSARQLLAEIFTQKGDYQQAVSELEKAAEFNDTSFLLHYQLGLLYLNLSKLQKNPIFWEKGIKAWERSLKLNPRNLKLAQELKRVRGN